MITSILVICMGNICRSPVAERYLSHFLPDITVHSAGLIARPGLPADSKMVQMAEKNGLFLADHCSQKFSLALGNDHDLILAMEINHLDILKQQYPQLSGKCRLLSHWNGRKDIPDPYKKSHEYYEVVYQRLADAAHAWVNALQV
ncbi:protein tyrosine phosphatase [Enterobacteriaceae bacterium H18W14]|uniref:arsenate reductase/protein-tyrosine-phosphatase family protein n=1 Tax=Dryocola boscaweniae TaxID=2925397 RepID=UPI0022F0EB6F|nr:protein tyrosine phosphatase [Dryocola boscaweniae]MCT4713706.1 protein tyrosine phosphatase [Dryocola boscaweniae]